MKCSFCNLKLEKISLKKFNWFNCLKCQSKFRGGKKIFTYLLDILYLLIKGKAGKFWQYEKMTYDDSNPHKHWKYNYLVKNINPKNYYDALDISGDPFSIALSLKKNEIVKDITSTSYNLKAMKWLKKKFPIKFFYYDLENEKIFSNKKYNLIVAWMCLYYSKNLQKQLSNIISLATKNCKIIISSPVPTLKTIHYFDSTHIYPPYVFFDQKNIIKYFNNKNFYLIKSEITKKNFSKISSDIKGFRQNFILTFANKALGKAR